MLPATATRSATAFLESIDEIGARTLPRRIEAHEQTGDERQDQCENDYGPMQRDSAFKRNILTSQFRNGRDCPEGQAQSDHTRDHANQRALKDEQSHDATPLRAERHAQSNFTSAAGEAYEQKIRDIAARNQQHGTYRGQQRHESRTKISRHI